MSQNVRFQKLNEIIYHITNLSYYPNFRFKKKIISCPQDGYKVAKTCHKNELLKTCISFLFIKIMLENLKKKDYKL